MINFRIILALGISLLGFVHEGKPQLTNFYALDDSTTFRHISFDKQIDLALLESTFYYKSYQCVRNHYATGSYKLIDEKHLKLNIDTLKSRSGIDALHKLHEYSSYGLPTRFHELHFELGDSLPSRINIIVNEKKWHELIKVDE